MLEYTIFPVHSGTGQPGQCSHGIFSDVRFWILDVGLGLRVKNITAE
jgi:hypothetical protein